jgi:hypothetical protein
MRIVPLPLIWAVPLLLVAGCEAAPTGIAEDRVPAVAPGPRPVPDVASRAQLVATIDHLTLIAGDPLLRARSTFGTTSRPTASVEEVLAELKGTLAWMDANQRWTPPLTRTLAGGLYADYASPKASGASWIEVSGAPGTMRYVYYRAYTVCIDCGIGDYPRGLMRARQYAGSVQTLSIDRTFSGGQGYATGEIPTTLTGDAQTATLSTDHWIDVWLGNDPHYYSSASGQV